MRLNQFSQGYQTNPDIAQLADGRLVVTWQSEDQDGSGDSIYARVVSADGTPIGDEFLVNTTTENDQQRSTIVATPDGGFAIAWSSRVNDTNLEVRLQRFDEFANAMGTETVLASRSNASNQNPEIAIGDDGIVRLIWIESLGRTTVGAVFFTVSGHRTDGSDGNDQIFGSVANDRLSGVLGDDTLFGDNGNDTLFGGTGSDSISGGRNDDVIFAGEGNDTAVGDNGRDRVFLNQGDDLYIDNAQGGEAGRDTVYAGFGDDTIEGGNGDDVFFGDWGNDVINARLGNDLVFGGDQFDTISAGEGQDTVFGGNGRNLIFLNQGNDLFNDNAQGGELGQDTVFAGFGNDTIEGGNGNDQFYGEWGDDLIFACLGDDTVGGGGGNDTINGGGGSDTLTGAEGTDTFVFNAFDAITGTDLVTDFELGTDVFRLEGATAEAINVNYDNDTNVVAVSVGDEQVAILRSTGDLSGFDLDDILLS